MKKLVSILLAGSMALSLLPGVAFAATDAAFTYTETFDTVSEGLLAGWTIYTPLEAANTVASVSDGALTLTNTADKGEWILFDTLTTVSNKNLIMECDITHLDNAAGNANSVAGLAYMVDIGTSSTTNIDDTFTGDGNNNKDPEFTGLKGNYAALKTDSANSYQQVSVRKQRTDRRCNVFNAPRDSENNETDSGVTAMNKNNGDPIHLKVAYQGVKYCLPYIYINNVNVIRNNDKGFNDLYSSTYSDQAMMKGKVGLYIKNASVKIDNLKISGIGTYTDATTYKASFKTAGGKYESIDDAIADVKVSECDALGNAQTDVTASATITGTNNNNGTGTISVSYNDYSATLSCKILPKETRGFVYEENFDTMADGQLPKGWTLYQNKSSWGKQIKAQVKDGALEITEDNSSGRGGYLIFDIPELADVNSQDLTMECDITLGNSLGITCANAADDNVGFAYAFDESKITGAIDNSTGVNVVSGGVNYDAAFRVRMYTNKENDNSGTAITGQILESDKYNSSNEGKTHTITSDVNKINTAETAQTMKLKMEVTNTNNCPTIYLDGTQVTCPAPYGDYVTPCRTNGKVGLYIKDTAVTIDNIKITGTKPDFAPEANSLAISSVKYDSANSKLNVMADASLTAAQSANSAIIAAVYDNNDRLVSAKTVSVDASKVVDYHGTIAINGASSAPAAGKVKLFFWDMTDINPFTQYDVQ